MPAGIERLAKLAELAERRTNLIRQLLASAEDLPELSLGPDQSDTVYIRTLLTLLAADVAALEGVLLAGLADPEHRHGH
ncbi:hypothetical protein [Streptomyces violascens]|uniref:hypothetical protein n=1 Tax=Streptomyces violascens TaxID=67381 RepID=UPI0019873C1B|nr:hypothetical protein [Streptomyces violascens]GGU49686.1 hypothetical protein GCM10010289_82790 [Streptomyces violascens]